MLDIVPSYNLVLYHGNIKPNFRPDFDLFGPNLGPQNFLKVLPLRVVRHCSNLSSNVIERKTNEPNLRKWLKKKLVLGPNLGP